MPATRARCRNRSKVVVLPNNPNWITIDTSDGNANRWPTNTTMNPDSRGNAGFMQLLSIDHVSSIKWRLTIGKALAKKLRYSDPESDKWVLKDWSTGYQFYAHNTSRKRRALYLIGSEKVKRFRSPAEFIPHAYWLITDITRNRSNCTCKYCTKKPQRGISSALGLSRISRLPCNDRNKVEDMPITTAREQNVPHSPRRIPEPFSPLNGPIQPVNLEREKDLRSLLGPRTLGERRWAREGELVWVKLEYPITVGDVDGHSGMISFWPGIIDKVNFRADITSLQTQGTQLANTSKASLRPATSGDLNASVELDLWTIVQKSVYEIKLLVVSSSVIYGSDRILPYQSYAPDSILLAAIQEVKFKLDGSANKLDGILIPCDSGEDERVEQVQQALFNRFRSYNPFPETESQFARGEWRSQNISTAAGAFAFAIQIASLLTKYWTPSDAWECKVQRSSAGQGVWSLFQEPPSSVEEHALSRGVLGLLQASDDSYATQTRFQGLWWGPERIWTGDLVRLKLGRYEVAPEGTEMIKKASGTKKHVLSKANEDKLGPRSAISSSDIDSVMHDTHTAASNVDSVKTGVGLTTKKVVDICASGSGAVLRSLFLRIDSLFLVQIPNDDGKSLENECRMSGMLYELADEGWEPDGDGGEFRESSETSLFLNAIETESLSPPSSKIQNGKISPSKVEPLLPSTASATAQLSPVHRNYPIPPAPLETKFRPILRDEHEVVMPLTELAGRYYPGLLDNPHLWLCVQNAMENPESRDSKAIGALDGFLPGIYNSVDSTRFLPQRGQMLRESEKMAWAELVRYWKRQSNIANAIVIDDD